jgi:hypothetical protein
MEGGVVSKQERPLAEIAQESASRSGAACNQCAPFAPTVLNHSTPGHGRTARWLAIRGEGSGGYVPAALLPALTTKFAAKTVRKIEWDEPVTYAPDRDEGLPNQSRRYRIEGP